MVMLKMFFPLFAFTLGSCNTYLPQNVPILYYADSNCLFVLNSENKLTQYNIDTDTSIFVKQIDSTIKTPLHLIAIDSSSFVLFSSSGANYTFISLEKEQTSKNNSFHHMSEAIKYKGGFVLNTISGIYICDNRMNIIGKIPCLQFTTCNKQIEILSNDYILSKENDNLEGTSVLSVYDTSYNLVNEIKVDGFINGWTSCNIFENLDESSLTFFITSSEHNFIGNWNYKTSHITTQNIGQNNYTPLKIDQQFIYLSYESDLVALNKYNGEQEWIFKNNSPLDDIEVSDKYVVVNHKNGVDVLNRKQGRIIKTVVSSTYRKSILYKSYLVVVEDKGQIKKYSLN